MSRKKKKKRRKIIRSEVPAALDSAPAPSASSGHSRLKRRVRGLVKGKRFEEAKALVDRELSPDSEERAQKRFRFLLSAWPECIVEDVKAVPAILQQSEIRKLFTLLALLLPPERIAEMEPFDALLTRDMLAISRASEAIADGDDNTAAEHLGRLGLRSPLRDARLFLEALAAFYRGDDVTAAAKMEKLGHVPLFRPLADRFLAAAKIGIGELDIETASKVPPPLGFTALEKALFSKRSQTIIGLCKAEALFARNEVSKAWKSALAWADTDDPVVIDLFHRDLVAAGAALGADALDLFERVRAAIPSPVACHTALMDIVGLENEPRLRGGPFMLRCSLAMTPGSLWSGLKPFELNRVKAALLHQAATMQKRSGRFDYFGFEDAVYEEIMEEMALDMSLDRLGFSDKIPSAVELLEKAIALDDRNEAYWQDLIQADKEMSYRPQTHRIAKRYLERFPESLHAAVTLVNTLSARKSYDKAIRTVEKTLKVQPMNTELQKALSLLLIRKAEKQVKSKKAHLALKSYQRVLEMRGAPPERVTQAVACLISLGRCREVSVDEALLLERAAEAGVGPWSLQACTAVEIERLGSNGKGADTAMSSLTPPDTNPTEADLCCLLTIFRDCPKSPALTSQSGRAFIRASVERGFEVMTRFDILHMASKCVAGELALRLLERCQEMPEADTEIMLERYDLALRVGRPKAYFKGAVDKLMELLNRFDPFSEDFDYSVVARLTALMDGIERRLRRRENATKKKAKAKASRAAKTKPLKKDKEKRERNEEEPDNPQIELSF